MYHTVADLGFFMMGGASTGSGGDHDQKKVFSTLLEVVSACFWAFSTGRNRKVFFGTGAMAPSTLATLTSATGTIVLDQNLTEFSLFSFRNELVSRIESMSIRVYGV